MFHTYRTIKNHGAPFACATHHTAVPTERNSRKMAAMQQKVRTSLAATLVESGLLRSEGLINGKWLASKSGKTFQVVDPATATEFAAVAAYGEEDTKLAVLAAEQSFDGCRSKTMQVRDSHLSFLSRLAPTTLQ